MRKSRAPEDDSAEADAKPKARAQYMLLGGGAGKELGARKMLIGCTRTGDER